MPYGDQRSPVASGSSAENLLGRLLYLVLTAAISYATWLALSGPLFRIHQVEVLGTQLASSDAVRRAASLDSATPFLVSTSDVEARVLLLGAPAHARLAFQLPDTAIIQIVERRPAYVWTVGEDRFLVADDGVVLGSAASQPLLEIVDEDRQSVGPGSTVDRRVLAEAAYLERVLPNLIGLTPSAFRVSHARGLSAGGPKGIQVSFGDDQNLDARLADLKPALDAALAAHPTPTLLDISVLHRPYYR
jgi:cell division septal protein FtsQ